MYKLLVLSILFCITENLNGQTIITGTVRSVENELLSGLTLLVYTDEGSSNIITYGISDAQGHFVLKFTLATDSVLISVKSMNYRDTVIKIVNRDHELNFVLFPQVHEIKEVNVRANPISVRGDTVNYIVNSFAKANDRSIGDVISRMPGFEVTELGQIYYQGQPIQKYYIEGLDLLEGRYALANKNLPHQSVGSVEVLRNHQPVKMLEDKMASDATSINIRLKNDVAITGTMYAGAGFSPFMRDVNLTPMFFHKKQQVIASWQSNNTANNLNTQHQPLEMSGGELKGLNNRKPELT